MMTEATGWPSELSEPAPPEPEAEPAPSFGKDKRPEPEAEAEAEPEPAWLAEVRNNVGGIVGAAIEELYNLVTGG
jgi:hypothetical protein